jgi:ligand-binding SRPBCC domain-containing protein
VLGRESGALSELEPLYKSWVGGPVGGGEQIMSWIHREDWIQATIFVLENSKVVGPVNLVAPEPVSNKSFSVLYAELFGQPVQIPAPGAALKLALGEMSALVLDGQNVRPQKLTEHGFSFRFPYLDKALLDLYEYEAQGQIVHEFYSTTQWVPATLDKVFAFFSDENNLERITPPLLNFHVQKKSTEKIMAGTLIDYTLKIHGLPAKWRTLIETWEPPNRFVDSQVSGPYARWHHTHSFEALAGGTLMTDRVHFRLPVGPLGRLFGLWLVKKDVNEIFRYRQKVIKELFASK